MEVNVRQPHRNLLSNSLTTRLKHSTDCESRQSHRFNHSHTRCQSNGSMLISSLKVLNSHNVSPRTRKPETSPTQDGGSPKSIQKQVSPSHGTKSERERSVLFDIDLRTRSGLSSASILPRLIGGESSMSQTPLKEEFPQFAFVDKDDLSHVKVFKMKGVFQPQNKYYNKIEPLEIADKNNPPFQGKKDGDVKSPRPPEERSGTGSPCDPPKSRMSRMSKKGLRVSWSRRSQYYSADEDIDDDDVSVHLPRQTDARSAKAESRPESREESVKTPSTTKSFSMKSENFFVKKRPGKRKVETIGIKWAVPTTEAPKPEETVRKPVRTQFGGNRSHNLMPVSTALDRNGRSINKMRWKVQSAESLRKAHAYQNWIEQLVDLKAGRLGSVTERIPNRANLSVMTQPVK